MTTLHNVYHAKRFAEMVGIGEDVGMYVLTSDGLTHEVTEACIKVLNSRYLDSFTLTKAKSEFKAAYLKAEPEDL
jgi:serine/threonine protein phosphatase PrpC